MGLALQTKGITSVRTAVLLSTVGRIGMNAPRQMGVKRWKNRRGVEYAPRDFVCVGDRWVGTQVEQALAGHGLDENDVSRRGGHHLLFKCWAGSLLFAGTGFSWEKAWWSRLDENSSVHHGGNFEPRHYSWWEGQRRGLLGFRSVRAGRIHQGCSCTAGVTKTGKPQGCCSAASSLSELEG